MQYSDFILSNQEIQNKNQVDLEINTKRKNFIDTHVKNNDLIKLKSAYLNMDSYYYHYKTKTMYKVTNICSWSKDSNPVFEVSNDQTILRLNHLL